MLIAYTRAINGSTAVCELQKNAIKRFLKKTGRTCERFFEDFGKCRRGAEATRKWLQKGYNNLCVYDKTFLAWEEMVLFAMENDVTAILVDMKCRLHVMKKLNDIFEKVCREKGIEIIETTMDEPTDEVKNSIAIYHYTNESKIKPVIFEKEIDKLFMRASEHCGSDASVPYVYVDYSLRKSEHKEYERFRQSASSFSTLFVTYFYHIEARTVTFFNEIKEMKKNGITIESLNEGVLNWTDEHFLDKTQRVAFYDCGIDEEEQWLLVERVKAFVKFKTAWEMEDIYLEKGRTQHESEKGKLFQLIQNAKNYDAVIVRDFNCLHPRTSMFFKIMMKLGVPVYSMKEGGGLYIEKSKCE